MKKFILVPFVITLILLVGFYLLSETDVNIPFVYGIN